MKIVEKTKENTVLFSELNPGDVFKSMMTDNFYLKTSEERNAVNLKTGNDYKFNYDTKVIAINCELVIK